MKPEQVLKHLERWCELYEESFGKPVPLDELATYATQVCWNLMPHPSPPEVAQQDYDTYIENWEELVERFYGREPTSQERIKFLTVIQEVPA